MFENDQGFFLFKVTGQEMLFFEFNRSVWQYLIKG